MKLKEFNIAWRLLVKDPIQSAVVILGLAIGVLAFFLLTGFVHMAFNYDQHITDNQHVYLVKTRFNLPGIKSNWTHEAPQTLRQAILDQHLAQSITQFSELPASMRVAEQLLSIPVSIVDSDFASVMNVQTITGNLDLALSRPDQLALTEDSALRLFGSNTALGKTLHINADTYLVAAIIKDPPINSTVRYKALVGQETRLWWPSDKQDAQKNWGRLFGQIYLKVKPGEQVQALEQQLQKLSDQSPLRSQLSADLVAQLGQASIMELKLLSLDQAYLDPDIHEINDPKAHGDRLSLWGLSAVAALILVLAGVNYLNFSTMQTLTRQREIATRKVLGASVWQVARQFIAESILVVIIATLVGLLSAYLLLPIFAAIMDRHLENLFSARAIAISLASAVSFGVCVGLYPAWVASRVRPSSVLSGRDNQEMQSGKRVRQYLSAFQLATAIGLTGITLAIAWQCQYATQVNPGFRAEAMVVLDMAPAFTPNLPHMSAFTEAVKHVEGVEAVAQSLEAVGRRKVMQKITAKADGQSTVTVEKKGIGPDFFQGYGITALAGRTYDAQREQFQNQNGVVLSLTAAHSLGFASAEEAVGKILETENGQRQEILGVVPDIRFHTLREAASPILYSLSYSTPVLTVRTTGKIDEVESALATLWKRYFPNEVLQMTREKSLLGDAYQDDVRLAKLLGIASIIALCIAGFGIYVLSAYSVHRLKREIIMRKLYGADALAIIALVSREMFMLFIASAMISLPIAMVIIQRYLAVYIERAPIAAWTLVIAFVTCAALAMLTISRHILVALHMRPIKALEV